MKLVLAGITLLVATIAVGVGCGPKETYCYEQMDTCEHVKKAIEQDAEWEAPPDADALSQTCFNSTGQEIQCPG
jgi:hypothetical protein